MYSTAQKPSLKIRKSLLDFGGDLCVCVCVCVCVCTCKPFQLRIIAWLSCTNYCSLCLKLVGLAEVYTAENFIVRNWHNNCLSFIEHLYSPQVVAEN